MSPKLNTKAQCDEARKQVLQFLNSRQYQKADSLLVSLCKHDKKDPDTWFLRAAVNGELGNYPAVVDYCGRAIKLYPKHPKAYAYMASAQAFMGRLKEASTNYQKALEFDPGNHELLANLGKVLQRSGHLRESQFVLEKALSLNDSYLPALRAIARVYLERGNVMSAIEYYRKIISHVPGDAIAMCDLASALTHIGELDEALGVFRRASQTQPGLVRAIAWEADVLQRMGDFEAAYVKVRELIDSGESDLFVAARVYADICKRVGSCDEAEQLLRDLIEREPVDKHDRIACCYALGQLYDRMNKYENAFQYFRKANELASYHFDAEHNKALISGLIDSFGSEKMSCLPRAQQTPSRPIFIIGMPRSGTTLVEQILASHSQIFGGGELDILTTFANELSKEDYRYPYSLDGITAEVVEQFTRRYLDRLEQLSSSTIYVTDKMPNNFFHVGLISLLFPDAKVIHCVRNPLDTCLSIYFQSLSPAHPYSADLANIAQYYLQYRRLMEHWEKVIDNPILKVCYEDLVADQEVQSRKLIEFCGLEWEAGCLDFHQHDRWAATASYDQVRTPMYSSSIDRWRNYENYIEPLKACLFRPATRY